MRTYVSRRPLALSGEIAAFGEQPLEAALVWVRKEKNFGNLPSAHFRVAHRQLCMTVDETTALE